MTNGIILVDDHTIVLDGLRALLKEHSDLNVLATLDSAREAIQVSRRLQPQLIITDLTMPELNGIELAHQLKTLLPEAKILCLSMHTEQSLIAAAFSAGVSGYVLKDCAGVELIKAIRQVMAGRTYLSPAITDIVLEGYKNACDKLLSPSFTLLSAREREILQMIAEGFETRQIAGQLHLSIKTIGSHRENIMRKLQIHSVAGLTKYAIREGLTSVNIATE